MGEQDGNFQDEMTDEILVADDEPMRNKEGRKGGKSVKGPLGVVASSGLGLGRRLMQAPDLT